MEFENGLPQEVEQEEKPKNVPQGSIEDSQEESSERPPEGWVATLNAVLQATEGLAKPRRGAGGFLSFENARSAPTASLRAMHRMQNRKKSPMGNKVYTRSVDARRQLIHHAYI